MSSREEHPPHIIAVTGATGQVGLACVNALQTFHKIPQIRCRAIVRDRVKADTKFEQWKSTDLEIAVGDANKVDDLLIKSFQGVHTAMIIVGATDREKHTKNYIQACKTAGVKHVVVLSVAVSGNKDFLFGREFATIEELWKATGISYTILRFPFFADNEMGNLQSIKDGGAFYYPVAPEKKYTYITVSDMGRAFQGAAFHFHQHSNKLYYVCADTPVSNEELASFYSKAFNKVVKFVTVEEKAYSETLQKYGVPPSVAGGICELWRGVNRFEKDLNEACGDYTILTGLRSTPMEKFIEKSVQKFLAPPVVEQKGDEKKEEKKA